MVGIAVSPEVNLGIHSSTVIRPFRLIEGTKATEGNGHAASREKLRAVLEKKGDILPAEHKFTQLIGRVSERLGVPDQTELMVMDTEELEAFFHPESRTIAFTRGFVRYFLEQGLSITEDHIAAVMGHELEHAHVIGDDYVEKLRSSYFERIKATQNHAEEYRADAEAMRRLSKAGYNPTAVVEVLRAFPLTLGRSDLGHPEQIDRIRKLEDRLADDEHPLSHTTKEQTPIDTGLIEWFAQDSPVYNSTEKLLHSSPQDLHQSLLESSAQKAYWETHSVMKHTERVAEAKALVAQEEQPLQRLTHKLMILSALHRRTYFIEDEPLRNIFMRWEDPDNADTLLSTELGKLPPGVKRTLENAFSPIDKSQGTQEVLAAGEFREQVQPQVITNDNLQTIEGRMAEMESAVDTTIHNLLNSFNQKIADQKQRAILGINPTSIDAIDHQEKFIEEVRASYEAGEISEDLLLTVFSQLDSSYQTKLEQEKVTSRRDKGLRVPEEVTKTLVDLRDNEARNAFMGKIKLSLALAFVDSPKPTGEVASRLSSIITAESYLSQDTSRVVSEVLLRGEDVTTWEDYLKGLSRETLPAIIRDLEQVKADYEFQPLFSPLRSLHRSYSQSSLSVERQHRVLISQETSNQSEIDFLRQMVVKELFVRGCQPSYEFNADEMPAFDTVSLSFDEWRAIALDPEFKQYRDSWVLKQYASKLIAQLPIEPELQQQVTEASYYDAGRSLSGKELVALIKALPEDTLKLPPYLDYRVRNFSKTEVPVDEYDAYIAYMKLVNGFIKKHPEKTDTFTLPLSEEMISGHLLNLLTDRFKIEGVDEGTAFMRSIEQLVSDKYSLNYSSLPDRALKRISELSPNQLHDLVNYLKHRPELDEATTFFKEALTLFAQVDTTGRAPGIREKRAGIVWDYETIVTVVRNHQENSVDWVNENFHPSELRDVLLVAIGSQLPATRKKIYPLLSQSSDRGTGRNSVHFDFLIYYLEVKKSGSYFTKDNFIGEGKLKDRFNDLLTRRYSFSTLAAKSNIYAGRYHSFKLGGSFDEIAMQGTPHQQFIAEALLEAEGVLFNREIQLLERIGALQNITRFPSFVRDILLEMMFQDELARAQTPEQIIEVGKLLLPLFNESSSLKPSLAIQVMRAEISHNPNIVKNPEEFIKLLESYLPTPSLARNSFLNLVENSAPLTPEQLRKIISMRMSSEGKTNESDTAPSTFIFNKLGELNREEKSQTLLWILGMTSEKPNCITNIENDFDGHLNNLPKSVIGSTEEEKEMLFKRMLLGAEGVLDIEAVPQEQRQIVEAQKREFLKTLSVNLLPDTMPNVDLFRNIFVTVLESSDPSHSSRTLIKIINRLTDAQIAGKQLPPEEVLTIALNELGVVGKKVSQSLAELDWVPDSYKRTLKKAQEEGASVPKRALLILAEDAGLLDDNAPIRIVSFNDLIGAASNKQAALLTVEVNDESVGLPRGRHEVVGKFKRPSAQKTENINHDLRVLRGILDILNREGYAETLPRDFSAQISNAVRRELDFAEEREFSKSIRADLNERNTTRRFKVSIPDIYYASDDVMMEAVAPGISLRTYNDLREAGGERLAASDYGVISERDVNQTLVTEALAELIATGNIHADLHPGNIFVDRQGYLTLIDLGMHEKLTSKQRFNTISLIAGLATGNERFVRQALYNLGWNLGDNKLDLKRFNFGENAIQLLRASQRTQTPPSEILGSIILATSKLSTFTKGFSNAELARMLIDVVDIREASRIIAHLIQAGARDFLTRRRELK